MSLPPIVSKLIARLSSPYDNEVISVARSIGRVLESNKLNWSDVANAINRPPPRLGRMQESQAAAEMRVLLEAVSRELWPSSWERDFIESILSRPSLDRLSDKQLACINKIAGEAHRRGVRAA